MELTYNEALCYIHSRGNTGLTATLDRITAVMEALGNPQDKFCAIHVAGTNGKGSVCAMLANVFAEAGFKTGLYISPFIIDFRERIQINGDYIPPETLVRLLEKVKETKIEVGEFELITAIGFLYFCEQKCDIVIAETGLGGRLDATNVLRKICVSVITKIGMDHMAILGDTVEKIAAEKCGIIKNSITVCAPDQKPNALEIIKKHAKQLIIPQKNDLQILKSDLCGNRFIYDGREFETSLQGKFQIENALTVIETVRNSGFRISYEHLYNGIKNTRFPARLEVLGENPLIILDGAHNPDGAVVLAEAMQSFEGKITAIVGMMRDKNYDCVLKNTLIYCKNVITVRAMDSDRALDENELALAAQKYCKNVYSCTDYAQAMDTARNLAQNDPIFIFGSLYLAAAIRPYLI